MKLSSAALLGVMVYGYKVTDCNLRAPNVDTGISDPIEACGAEAELSQALTETDAGAERIQKIVEEATEIKNRSKIPSGSLQGYCPPRVMCK